MLVVYILMVIMGLIIEKARLDKASQYAREYMEFRPAKKCFDVDTYRKCHADRWK